MKQKINELKLRNDGLIDWEPFVYSLNSRGNEFGADVRYPLAQNTPVDEIATWEIPAIAPTRPGIFRQEWQLMSGTRQIGGAVTVYLIVVPEEARQMKEEIDQQIQELYQRGEEEIEQFIYQLEQESVDWVSREITNAICPQQFLLASFIFGVIIILHSKRH